MVDVAGSKAPVRKRLVRSVRGWVSKYPRLYLPLVANRRAFDGTRKAVGRQTELVIEGFPRCGNSFAFAAFRQAQNRPVHIAHHLHASAQVVAATRRGIPTLVLIRPPDDAVVSFLLRSPSWTPHESYAAYVRFYTRIFPARECYVVATFDQVTADFGKVTRRLNRRFGTSFAEFDHRPENVDKCFEYVDRIATTFGRTGKEFEMRVARPSSTREEQKAAVQSKIQSPSLERIRRVAQEIYGLYDKEATA